MKIIYIEEISYRKLCIDSKYYGEGGECRLLACCISAPHIKNSAPFPSVSYSSPVLKEMEAIVFLCLLYYPSFIKMLEKCKGRLALMPPIEITLYCAYSLCSILWILILVWSFYKMLIKCTERISFCLCTACGHCNSGWIWSYIGQQAKCQRPI